MNSSLGDLPDATAVIVRRARRADIAAIIAVYASDPLTGHREKLTGEVPPDYFDAFDRIDADPNQTLLVAEVNSLVVGSLQVTIVQHLLFRAFRTAILEAMFVLPSYSGKGVGTALMDAAIRLATEAGCKYVELTSNKQRSRAHDFYRKHGFEPTHEGFKRPIPARGD